METVEAELRGASNGTRWAAFAVGSCAPWMRDFFGEKKRENLEHPVKARENSWKIMENWNTLFFVIFSNKFSDDVGMKSYEIP